MKHLLFFLFLIPILAFGQTADYSMPAAPGIPAIKQAGNRDHAYVFEIGPDTLDASVNPDTLTIEFDQSFYALMNIFFQTKQIGDLAGSVSVFNGCDGCDYQEFDSGSIPASGDNTLLTTIHFEGTKIMIKYIAATGEGVITSHLILKPQ